MTATISVKCDAEVTEYGTCTRRASSHLLYWPEAREALEEAGWRFRTVAGALVETLCPFHAGTERMRKRL